MHERRPNRQKPAHRPASERHGFGQPLRSQPGQRRRRPRPTQSAHHDVVVVFPLQVDEPVGERRAQLPAVGGGGARIGRGHDPHTRRQPQGTDASFQHDETAVAAVTAMGYQNVMFGSDYPHMEGTYGHTQETPHGLLDDVDDATRYRITCGAFLDLFPEVGPPPALAA